MSRQKHKTVTWEEPPPAQRGRYDWAAIAAQLRAKPGEWAKVFDRDLTSVVNAIRIGGIKDLPLNKGEGGFEVTTTNNRREDPDFDGVRTCTLFLRYVPEPKKKGRR